MKRKAFSLFMVLAMIVGLFPAIVYADNDHNVILTVGSIHADSGDIVEIPINLNHDFNEGFAALDFVIEHDRDSLTLTDVKIGKDISTDELIEGKFQTWSSTDALHNVEIVSLALEDGTTMITSQGEIATLVFQINENAKSGDYPITLTKPNGGFGAWITIFDPNQGPVPLEEFVPSVNGGSITIGDEVNSVIGTSTITADTSSVGEVYEGKSFTVPVKITDNPGFTACILEADYDKDALELTSITNGDVATSLAANDIVTGTANITSDSSITKESGTLFNYTFKVKEGAAPGDYDITMKYRNDDTGNFCNGEDDVPATFVKGTVKVVEKPEVIPADSQTTVWLSTDTSTVNPDGTFNVDVFMKSDQLLASGQVDLAYNPAVAKIQSITVNSPQGVKNGESNYDNEAGTAKISFYGDNLNASGDAGLKVATIQMNALTAGTSDMKITSAVASPKGSDGNSLDQKVTISEEAAEVTVEVVEPSGFRVIPYVNGHRYLVMYEPSVAITEGVPTYLGQDMFWSEQYSFEANGTKGVWVCLTDKDVSLELKESDFGRNAEGTKSTVCYPAAPVQGYLAGDVSGNGKVNIIDAQAAYDLSNRVYSTYDPIDMLHWLMADVNGNSLLEASDAQAIQYYIHYNTFALPAEG